jgi:glycosyltransferase involved in cell wall biosynthesis/SAM-dependent methyltransferase
VRIVAISWKDTANPHAGGCELLVDRLLTGLVERGNEVSLISGGPVGEHQYEVYDSGGTFTQYLRAPLACRTKLRDADIVIDVSNGLPFFTPLWTRTPSICFVMHDHGAQWASRFPKAVAKPAELMERHVVPSIYGNRQFVAISESTALSLISMGVDNDHVSVIEPGVDVPQPTGRPKSLTPLFVALTRLVPHKRVDLLLETWRLVQPVIGGRFIVMGTGPDLPELRRIAEEIPGVEVVGWIEEWERNALLEESWFLVHAALREGWGMVTMEAGAVGTPSLVLDAPGVRDSVLDDTTGIIVRWEEDPCDALAREWIALAVDESRRRRLGQAAKARAYEYTWDRMVDSWESVAKEAATVSAGRTRKEKHLGLRQPPAPVARGSSNPRRPSGSRSDLTGLRRMATLLKSFRTQFDDPDQFYSLLAADTIALIEQYQTVESKRVLDVGGGSGYFAEAFRKASGSSAFIEPEWDEMTEIGRGLGFGIVGDGCELPLADASFDIGFSSNVLEHVLDPWKFFAELIRVVRPGGIVFLAFTNWLSPFGGHETSPWHYLGGARAARRYEERLGYPPKNLYGRNLFPLSVGEVLKWVRQRSDVALLDAFPRYYPSWSKPILHVPGVREVATWNLAVVLRRCEIEQGS